MDERFRIYRRLLDRMADILRDIQETDPSALEGKVSPEIHRRLDRLENQIEAFARLHEKAIQERGLEEREINKMLVGKDPTLSQSDRNLLSYADKIERDATRLRRLIAHKKEAFRRGEKEGKPRKQKKRGERRKKFKRLGSDEDWIPL